jgi:transposase
MTTSADKTATEAHAADDRADRRRTFTADYKARGLAECDAALANDGTIGEILRREGLYSSHLHDWRRARTEGGESALARKRGRPPLDPVVAAQRKEIERLERENAALKERLRRSEIILDAQKQLAELLAPLSATTSGSSE